jgi:dihydroorotase
VNYIHLKHINLINVHSFQISALVLMDHIWFARNKLIYDDISPVPLNTLKCTRTTTQHHLLAWQNGIMVA